MRQHLAELHKQIAPRLSPGHAGTQGSTNGVPQNTCNTFRRVKCNIFAKCLAEIFGHVSKAVLQRSLGRVDTWVASVEASCCNYHPWLPWKNLVSSCIGIGQGKECFATSSKLFEEFDCWPSSLEVSCFLGKNSL